MTQSASSLCSCTSWLSPLSGMIPHCTRSGPVQGVRALVSIGRECIDLSQHAILGMQLCNAFGAHFSPRKRVLQSQEATLRDVAFCILQVMISCALCLFIQSRLPSPGQLCTKLTRCSLDFAP